jgi:hypothetical protein
MNRTLSPSVPEVGRTLLHAGLWAVTGTSFPIDKAGIPATDPERFREALVARTLREKMMPMLAAYSRANDLGLGDLPALLSEVFSLISRAHYLHLRPVMDLLAQRGVPVVLLKGADLDLSVYQKSFPRTMGDIDLLVRPPDVPAVTEAFNRHGFVQGVLNRSLLKIVPLTNLELTQAEEESIELVEFSKLVSVPELMAFKDVIDRHLSSGRMVALDDTYYLAVGYDVHIHLSIDFDLQDVWHDLRTIEFPELGRCRAQSFTDLLWFLAARCYHELLLNNAFVMRAFLDALLVAARHRASLDWDRVTFIAEKYKLKPALYYTFWHINELLGDLIPAPLLDSLCPSDTETERGHDWGDFVPKMLGDVRLVPILDPGQPE